jgi:hypothetical protein
MDKTIILGNKVKDLVTGFTGIVTGEVKYMNGCEKWAIDGKVVNNQIECIWSDKGQVVKVGEGIVKQLPAKKDDGGPVHSLPPRG